MRGAKTVLWRDLRRRVARCAAALVACLATACIVSPRDAECPADAECERCIERTGCGYCAQTAGEGGCMAGTSYGPSESERCPDAAWRFTACDEPPPVLECARIGRCAECAETDGCGFCPETRDCRARDHALGCELETDPDSLLCRDDTCRARTDCADCARSEACGFCLDEVTCRLRDGDSGCELVTDPDSLECAAALCLQASTCEECAELTGCGWCMDERQCRHRERPEGCELEVNPDWTVCGEAACRAATSCGDCLALEGDCRWCYIWDFCTFDDESCPSAYSITTECPPENECASDSHDECSTCLDDPRCGFCNGGIYWQSDYYSGCLVVDAVDVPYGAGGCSDLRTTVGDCPPPECETLYSCETCVDVSGCVWCTEGDYSGSCHDESSSGGYFCSRWYSYGADCW